MNELITNANVFVEGMVHFGQMMLMALGLPATGIVGLYAFYRLAKRVIR